MTQCLLGLGWQPQAGALEHIVSLLEASLSPHVSNERQRQVVGLAGRAGGGAPQRRRRARAEAVETAAAAAGASRGCGGGGREQRLRRGRQVACPLACARCLCLCLCSASCSGGSCSVFTVLSWAGRQGLARARNLCAAVTDACACCGLVCLTRRRVVV
jgi:hypothetical protein